MANTSAPSSAIMPTPPSATVTTQFAVEGTTCTSCVRRIEKALAKVPGVQEATVNLSTERARVVFDAAFVDPERPAAAVEQAGYRTVWSPIASAEARPAAANAAEHPSEPIDQHALARHREIDALRRKSLISLAIGLAMMAATYLPCHFAMVTLAPLLLVAASVVQFWAGGVFYQAAWSAARHGTTNMNTLVALGTSAAYGYSAFVTLWPGLATRWGLPAELYYQPAVIIVALILLGRWLEARARGQTSAAIKKLIGLQARTARVLRDG
ncbi:MAG: cation transporter, partial [Chloroflexota bacterium]